MSRAQILIVEDDRIVARDMKERLIEQGYAVPAVADSGEEAIRKAVEIQPDLVLMDIVLAGGMDGIEASRQIHERQSVPIVYLTAYADARTVARARETSPCAYLVKPYNDRELYTTVAVTLEKHRQEDRVIGRVVTRDAAGIPPNSPAVTSSSCVGRVYARESAPRLGLRGRIGHRWVF